MVHKYFIFLFTLVLLTGSVVAEDPSFQFNTEFDLKRPCFDNGFFCDAGFTCNITILDPDGVAIIDNQIMDNQGSFRNITVSQSLNNQLGFLDVIESCSNATVGGPDTFRIAITGDGNPVETFPHQFFFILIALILVATGMINDRLRMFKHMGAILMMVMGVITLFPGYSFINYSNLIGLSLGSIFIGLGFYFLIEDAFSRDKQEDSFDERSVYVDEEI